MKDYNLGFDSIEEIWNSDSFLQIREKFLRGEFPKECSKCFQEERVEKKSKRIKENEMYFHLIKDFFNKGEGLKRSTKDIKTLDLRLGNLCNLKCTSCNPIFSSPIEKEMKEQWPDRFFEKDFYKNVTFDNSWFESQQFFKNINELLPQLEFIYVSGGEPTINQSLIKFLKRSVDENYSANQELRFNTNLKAYQPEFYELLSSFNKVDISVSLDAVKEDLFLIRYPLEFHVIEKNLEKLLSLRGNIEITFNCTTSLLNIFSLKDFYQYIQSLSQRTKRYFHVSIDLVHEPEYLSLRYLNSNLRDSAINEITTILEETNLKDSARNDLKALIPMLKESLPTDFETQKEKRKVFISTMKAIRKINLENLRGMSCE